MNEDARNEKSAVGKAINTAIMGAGAYGLHKGVTSDKAYNWAANQRNNAVANGVLKYNQYTDEFKKQYTAYKNNKNNINPMYVNAEWSYSDVGDVVNKNSSKANAKKSNQILSLKEGLSDDALKRQVHLDNLRNGGIDRRTGETIRKLKGAKRRKVSGRLKNVTKAL